ncbi:Hypothetical protein CINCED_3A006445 [Cinara cedri]|nr:Hypothetical protein CINCED_3A006445 [Cinara cedri]
MGYMLIKILKTKLQGLYVNEHKLITMKSNFNKTPVIFVPSHRSYQDFILMAFICFHYNIEIPYVAAAMDFKDMKIMGNILKQCGAFFLHRGKNSQDDVYRSVLNTYIKHLITRESSPLQFFMEGTRSRSNKSVVPKLGILKCIYNTLTNNDVEDITIIPISINYDYLLEDKLFCYELIGLPKPKESTLGLIKSIKNMDDHYGNIYINFASPISLRKYIHDINWTNSKNDNVITTLAYEIMYRQQHGMILSYFNILAVALAYNYFRNKTYVIHIDVMVIQIKWISELLRKCGAEIEAEDSDIESRIIDVVQIHQNFVTMNDKMIELKKKCVMYDNVDASNSSGNQNKITEKMNSAFPLILNQLYINPSLHFVINMGLINVLSNCRIIWNNNILDLEESFILLRRLFEFEFVFYDGWETQDFNNSLSMYIHTLEKERELLRCLTINPFIICYRQIYNSLKNMSQTIISENLVFKTIFMDMEFISHPYGLTKDLIKTALCSLQKMKIIKIFKNDETIQYKINKTNILDLVRIFDEIIMTGNNSMKSKI